MLQLQATGWHVIGYHSVPSVGYHPGSEGDKAYVQKQVGGATHEHAHACVSRHTICTRVEEREYWVLLRVDPTCDREALLQHNALALLLFTTLKRAVRPGTHPSTSSLRATSGRTCGHGTGVPAHLLSTPAVPWTVPQTRWQCRPTRCRPQPSRG
eukprot:353867-Chlamydomonas_euryale.AAC.4